jgi:ParB family transcriptional regulator, chromosome partitioning protein
MRRRGGLGRGLEALIPPSGTADDERTPAGSEAATGPSPAADADLRQPGAPTFRELPLDAIDRNPRQPRAAFDEESLAELSASIQAVGVLQPIVVRPHGDRWQLVMGERRVRAAGAAGLDRIPAIVRTTEDDYLLRDALLENIHRDDLNPLEEAAAYEQLLTDFGVTHEELATRLGRSRPTITNTIRLLRLPGSVQRRIAAGTLVAGHANAILSLKSAEQQERLADRIVAEGLTVRMTEELVRRARLGEPVLEAGERRVRPRPLMQAPGMAGLAERLSDRLETRVRVQLGKRKGKVLIEFATLDDLQRICDAIGLDRDEATASRGTGIGPRPGAPGPADQQPPSVSSPSGAGAEAAENDDRPPRVDGEPSDQPSRATARV